MSSTVLCNFTHIQISILYLKRHANDWRKKNVIDGFLKCPNKYISNISNLYNPNKNMSLAYQMKCDIIFSDPESDHIFSHSCFSVTYLVYIYLFSYVVIIHLLRIGKCVAIYCRLIIDWIESTQARILFTAQCRAGIHNQIRNNTWRSISIYHRLITLNIFRLFDCNHILSI